MDRGTNSSKSIIDPALISNSQKPSVMGVADLFNTDGLKSTHGLCTAKKLMVGFVNFVLCSRRTEKV
jgi:hypothetical protein